MNLTKETQDQWKELQEDLYKLEEVGSLNIIKMTLCQISLYIPYSFYFNLNRACIILFYFIFLELDKLFLTCIWKNNLAQHNQDTLIEVQVERVLSDAKIHDKEIVINTV